jgi:serine/threonine protein kinase
MWLRGAVPGVRWSHIESSHRSSMIGRTLSHYRIVAQLGAGGMGVVYRAEDVRLGREVALKVVSQDFAHDDQALQRLRSEARAASALNHPNICTIFDIGEDEGRPFIVMELIRGATLRERVDRGALKMTQLIDIAIEIADALHATHTEGIIHRDIKPGNIFVTDRGHVKVLDFGLAKLTEEFPGASTMQETIDRTAAGVALGTISYMSPEQAQGEPLDGRSDLFSLGVVLYECATGRHPFAGPSSTVTLAGILSRAPASPLTVNPDLPPRLQEIISNCLEKDRELRYQSAADLRADLKRLRRDLESGASPTVDASGAVSGSRRAAPGPGSAPTGAAASISAPTTMAPAASLPSMIAMPIAPRSRLPLLLGVAIGAALAAGAAYVAWLAPAQEETRTPVAETRTAAPADAEAVRSRLALAATSLQSQNYRAAAAYAGEVLAIEPENAEARRIASEARGQLARFDDAIGEARTRLAASDPSGAARALETARALDPTAPTVIELSGTLADLVRSRQAARDDRASSRPAPQPAAPASPPPAVSAPVPVSSTAPSTVPVVVTPPSPPQPAPAPAPAATPAPPVAPTPAPPSPAPSTAPPTPPAPTAEQDEAAIRRVTATYARAIETKDLNLFRSIKPNLSREEERRLEEGFRVVTSQRVNLTVLTIERQANQATVVVQRRDTIVAGGREQTAESRQTLQLSRAGAGAGTGWVITEIR